MGDLTSIATGKNAGVPWLKWPMNSRGRVTWFLTIMPRMPAKNCEAGIGSSTRRFAMSANVPLVPKMAVTMPCGRPSTVHIWAAEKR